MPSGQQARADLGQFGVRAGKGFGAVINLDSCMTSTTTRIGDPNAKAASSRVGKLTESVLTRQLGPKALRSVAAGFRVDDLVELAALVSRLRP